MDMARSRIDCREPGGIIFPRVPQQSDAVAFDEPGARGAGKRLIGKLAHRRHGGYLTHFR